MNQFTINVQPSDTLWYTPMEHKTYPFFYPTNNNNYYQTPHHNLAKFDDVDDSDNSSSNANADRSDTTTSSTTTANPAVHDKEHMFEKPLTPSDVGKLNRLVIPKQHAEKYFPLAGVSVAAAAANTTAGGEISGSGGVLLGFEDEGGKCWRFRYSYWNSSQSYVLTKGWSRYVKEKKLDAGDVVLFERHRFDPDRFFIGWRRRGSNPVHHVSPAHHHQAAASAANWTASRSPNSSYGYNNYHNHHHHHHQNTVQLQQDHTTYAASHQITPASYSYQPETLHPGTEVRQRAKKSGSGNSKRVRLFGVNLECQLDDNHDDQENDDEPQTSDGSSLSSQGHQSGGFGSGSGSGLSLGPTTYNNFDYMGYHPTINHHNHMDMNFPHDVNQMRNRLG